VISGTIRCSTDQALIPGTTLTTNPATNTATTAAQGVYTLTGVNPGTYTVMASAASYVSGSVTATVPAGQTATADIALDPQPGAITGTVRRSTDDAGIAGATVTTIPANASAPTAGASVPASLAPAAITTDAQGSFTIPDVPAGTIR
jgi:large repetitive protein